MPCLWHTSAVFIPAKQSAMFTYALNRQKLRRIRRREGRYLLRTNLTENADPALLWQ